MNTPSVLRQELWRCHRAIFVRAERDSDKADCIGSDHDRNRTAILIEHFLTNRIERSIRSVPNKLPITWIEVGRMKGRCFPTFKHRIPNAAKLPVIATGESGRSHSHDA